MFALGWLGQNCIGVNQGGDARIGNGNRLVQIVGVTGCAIQLSQSTD